MHGLSGEDGSRRTSIASKALAAVVAVFTITGCNPGGPAGTNSPAATSQTPTPGAPDPASTPAPNQSQDSQDNAETNDPTRFGDTDNELPPPKAKPGELLVKFKAGTPSVRIAAALPRSTVASARAFAIVPGLQHVKLAPGVTLDAALEAYRSRTDVEYAEPNYVRHASTLPDDPRFAEQWGLNNTGQTGGIVDSDIDGPESWDLTQGDTSLVVAVIDSGVDYTHPDLAANIFRNTPECTPNGVDDDANGYVDDCQGIDALNNDSDPADDNKHGTHVAGIIGAVGNNGIGIAGVAWNVKILPCKFLGADGSGTDADAIECLEYVASLAARGVNVVATNNSWGGGAYSQALTDAIAAQRQRGILFVAAAGNFWTNHNYERSYPCDYDEPNIVCVAATADTGAMAWFSDYGRHSVHVGAPGFEILSTLPAGAYGELDGTSMAAPHVAGIAALLKAHAPSRDWRAIRNLILAGGKPNGALLNKTLTGREASAIGSLTCSNSTVLERVEPALDIRMLRPGTPVLLRMLHINCASPNGAPTVAVSPGGATIVLHDDGLSGDTAADDGIYSATWTSNVAGTYTLSFEDGSTTEVTFDAHLLPGFPLRTHTPANSGVGNDPEIHTLVGNIDGDPEPEILRSAVSAGLLYAWNHDGTRAAGWPPPPVLPNDGLFEVGIAYPVLGRLTGSSHLDVFASFTAGNQFAFSGTGQVLPGWPVAANSDHPAATADLDGDGLDEIIFEENNGTPNPSNNYIKVRRADGTYPPGWPITLSASTASWKLRTPAIADLFGDGTLEIIAADNQRVHAYHHDGRAVAGFPVSVSVRSYPAVGDVDGDGAPEIVVVSQAQDGTRTAIVSILGNNGVIERTIVTSFEVVNDVLPALADLDDDGIPEIVIQFSRISSTMGGVGAWRGNGTLMPGWPVTFNETPGNSAAVVGDVDGDGAPDIVLMTLLDAWYGDVRAYNRIGQPLAGFPKLLPSRYGAVPAIADLDLDGRNEVIVSASQWWGFDGQYDAAWAFDLGGPSGPSPIEWGQFMNDEKHSGFYKTGKNLATSAYLTTQIRGTGSVTSSPAGIDCGADCLERYPKGTSVTLTASEDTFANWLGACEGQGNPCVVSIQDYTTAVAAFGAFQLSVNVSGAGTVTSAPAGIDCPDACSSSFPNGGIVTLTASPQASASFSGWSGACSGQSSTCSVTMDAARSVFATFAAKPVLSVSPEGTGSGTVVSSPPGIDCGTDCSESYEYNAIVTLTATAAPGSAFIGWRGDCVGSASTCTVTMFGSHHVGVSFERVIREIQVVRTGSGTGTVVSGTPGINCGGDCSESYLQETTVTLTAQPDAGSVFSGWFGACAGNEPTCTVQIPNGQISVGAVFNEAPTFQLGVSRIGDGEGTVTSQPAGIACGDDCSHSFAPGAVVTLTAEAGAGSVFTGWSGPCSGIGATCNVSMTSSRFVNARFSRKTTLTVALAGTGSGSVTSGDGGVTCGSDCSESYDPLALVTLNAVAAPDSVFNGWSGACAGTGATCTVPMAISQSVSASFTLKPILTVTLSGNGSGTVTSTDAGVTCGDDCTESYTPSASVVLTASPAAGSLFDGWSGACSGQGTLCTVTVDANKSVGASFRVAAPPPGGSSGNDGGGGGGGGRLDWAVLALSATLLLLQQWPARRRSRARKSR